MMTNNQGTFWAVFRGVMDVVDIPVQKTAPGDTWALADSTMYERTCDSVGAVVRATSDPNHPRLDKFLKGLETQ
jgi:hypothetical protein